MSELRLTRSPEDRKLFVLAGVGTIRNGRWFKRSAELCAETGDSWQVDRKGFRARPVFTDGVGGEPARFEVYGTFKRGGRLEIAGAGTYELKPASHFKERYALSAEGRELATIEASGWSAKRPVTVEVGGQTEVDDLVLLAACWMVQQYAQDLTASGPTAPSLPDRLAAHPLRWRVAPHDVGPARPRLRGTQVRPLSHFLTTGRPAQTAVWSSSASKTSGNNMH